MSGKSVRVVVAALLLMLVIALSVHSVAAALHSQQLTPAILVEEFGTTGS